MTESQMGKPFVRFLRTGQAIALLVGASLLGCDGSGSVEPSGSKPPERTAGSEPTSPSPEASSADEHGDETSEESVVGSDRSSPPDQLSTRSQHPIDQLPEGKAFRIALDALDNGDQATAEQVRKRLADHPQYGVLAAAIGANILAKEGSHEQALQAAEEISRVPVMRAEAYMIAGEVFRSQQQWSKAIGAYDAALQSHPENIRAHRWLGVIFHDTGAMRLATDHLRRVADLDHKDFRSLRLSGLIHYDYQSFEEAVDDYRRALQRNPPEPMETEIRIELADSLRELRSIDEALATLEPCDETVEVLTALAKCWETQGETDRAAELARRAVQKDPTDHNANFVLGRLLLSQRMPDEAIAFLQRATDAQPSNHEPRFLLGRALLQAGRDEEGRQQLKRSEELKQIFLEMAELHLDAVERPNDADLRFQLGQLAERLGRPAIARTWYTAALGLEPQHADASTALARLARPSAP